MFLFKKGIKILLIVQNLSYIIYLRNMSIYDIPSQIQEKMDKYLESFDPETGEETEEWKKIQSELHGLLEQKSNIIEWMLKKRQNALSDITSLLEEIKRLQERMNWEQKLADRMEESIKSFVGYLDSPKKYSNWTVSYRKSESVVIEDIEKLDKSFVVEKITKQADKALIKESIKAGKEVTGATIQTNHNLQIK